MNVRYATKLLPPRRRLRIIRRRRLIEFLHNHVELRLQFVCAGPGYGKTTLLVDFADDLDMPVCWYSLGAEDRDPAVFLESLVASIRRVFPFFGAQVRTRTGLSPDPSTEALSLLGTLVSEIESSISDYFVLVIEDFNLVSDSPGVKTLVNSLIERLPENCHLIVSSREMLDLPCLPRLLSQREVAGLGSKDLIFTPEEVSALFLEAFGREMTKQEAQKLATEYEGWVTGILLASETLWDGLLSKSVQRQKLVPDYLMSEVYAKQPALVREFVLKTSVLDEMSPEVCDALLDSSTSTSLLEELDRSNLFVTTFEGNKYKYHRLFLSFLREKFQKERPEKYRLLHLKAAQIFEVRSDWDCAVAHYLSAQEYVAAAGLVESKGESVLKSGKWQTVASWIDALPETVRATRPLLDILRAEAAIRCGDTPRAATLMDQIISKATNIDTVILARAYLVRSSASRLRGFIDQAIEHGQTAISLLKSCRGEGEALIEAYKQVGASLGTKGKLAEAQEHLERGVSLCSAGTDLSVVSALHDCLGITCALQGNSSQAVAHLEQAKMGWAKLGNDSALADTLNNIGRVYYNWGQHGLSLSELTTALQPARSSGNVRTEAMILVNIGDIKRDLGAFQDAISAYSQALELAQRAMELRHMFWAKQGMGDAFRLAGDFAKSEALLGEAAVYAEESGHEYELAASLTSRAALYAQQEQLKEACQLASRACKLLEKVGAKQRLAMARLHYAYALLKGKEFRSCIEQLKKLGLLLEDVKLESIMAEARTVPSLIDYAASKRIGGTKFVILRRELLSRTHPERRAELPVIPVETKVVPLPEIRAYSFGQARVILDSRPVTESEWRSSKAKEMFFYLLSQPGWQRREAIVEDLWPEVSPGKGRSSFHSNLHRLRRAIYPECVTHEGSRYSINPDPPYWLDMVEFQDCLTRASKLPRGSDARARSLRRALELYHGPFLEEFFSEWCETIRVKLEQKYLEVLASLAGYHAGTGDYEEAKNLLEKILAIDYLHDEAHYKLIQLHMLRQDQVSALRQYNHYAETLKQELDEEPSDRFVKLRERICVS